MPLAEVAIPKTIPIVVRPYFNPEIANMGLEKYGLSLWDGVYHDEQLASIEIKGLRPRYVTGLNEFAPEVKQLPEDLKVAKIKEIRRVLQKLEKEIGNNPIADKYVKEEDGVEFYKLLKMFHPDNSDFWGSISMRCSNQPIHLDPENPEDLIKIYAIEVGGFALIGRSYEDARSRAIPPKFYLDKFQETATTQTEHKKIRNKALSELQTLMDQNQAKLFYVAKIVDGSSIQYRKSTPNDVTYNNMDKYINGEGIEKNKKRAPQFFLEVSRQDMETLKLRAIIKDATYLQYIGLKPDGFIYHTKSGTLLGRNAADIVEYFKNPLHDQILKMIMDQVESIWNA